MTTDTNLVLGDDGHWNRVVGPWSEDKHHFLARYLDAFTTSMREKWRSLHYVDLFSGPGRCRIRDTQRDVDGSPLIAAKTRHKFTCLHFCDIDPRCTESLQARLEGLPQPSVPQVVCGNANEKIHEIVARIPKKGSLTLAFLDPTGLHLHYATLEVLAARRCDLILFFPDRTDARRNLERYYESQKDSNLDLTFGPDSGWRTEWDKCPKVETLRQIYERQLRQLGYCHFDPKRICDSGRPLYLLIFCSRHRTGLTIWRNVSSVGPNGQRQLPFAE